MKEKHPSREIFTEDLEKVPVSDSAAKAFRRKPYESMDAAEYLKGKIKDGDLNAGV